MSKLLVLFLIVATLFSCKRTEKPCCAIDVPFEEPLLIDYASNFELIKTNVGYSLEILNPENGEIEKTYSLKSNTEYKIISLSATLNGMISILNEQNKLIGIGKEHFIYDTLILDNLQKEYTQPFGDETNISLEKIIASNANIVFYNGFGDKFPNEDKLAKLGIAVIPIYDWRENHPLGKAEWIKLVGIITGKEEEAKAYFSSVVEEYDRILAITDTISHQPTTLAGSMFGDIWFAPGGDSYFATLLKDAGANYIYSDTKGTASQEFSMERILKDNIATDFWINPTLPTKSKLLDVNPKAKYLNAFNNNSYCYSAKMSKFWEQSAAMPHLVLRDLVQIFHPEIEFDEELYFYQKVD
ncbi:MAG: ABC transporter substrate-binding protein [Fluviicola sp.]|nr:ABC transporter substrate-binding protein [Fluviicola sp.]